VTNNLTVSIPQSVVWLLRLASNPILSRKAATMQILAMDGISSAQLESAIKAARLVKVATRSERDKRAARHRQNAVHGAFGQRTRPADGQQERLRIAQ
jgi:hypothetical protein